MSPIKNQINQATLIYIEYFNINFALCSNITLGGYGPFEAAMTEEKFNERIVQYVHSSGKVSNYTKLMHHVNGGMLACVEAKDIWAQ